MVFLSRGCRKQIAVPIIRVTWKVLKFCICSQIYRESNGDGINYNRSYSESDNTSTSLGKEKPEAMYFHNYEDRKGYS